MKKQLLTTTAMVAAGAIALGGAAIAKPKVTVNGNTTAVIGVGDNDDAFEAATQTGGVNSWDTSMDGEVHFNASTKLDNGISIKARIELEGNQDGDQIDEHWMRISGSFGEIRLGSTDAPDTSMTAGYYGSSAGVGASAHFHTTQFITNPAAVQVTNAARTDLSSDSEKIQYYTPRTAGFQLGFAYAPSSAEDNNGLEVTNGVTAHIKSLGANYVTKAGGASIAIAAGWTTGTNGTVNQDDPERWSVAAKVSMSNFALHASYIEFDEISTISTGATATAGQETFEIGANYKMGANSFSILMQDAEAVADATAGGFGDEASLLQVAYKRTLGPGVSWSLTGQAADYDNGAVGAASSTSNSGEAIQSRLTIKW